MRFAVSFVTPHGTCAVTGRSEPMDFTVPVPDDHDPFEGAVYAISEVARVRGMSPRELPELHEVRCRVVPSDEPSPSHTVRPILAAVPDRSDP